MSFDAAIVFVTKFSLLFRLAPSILWPKSGGDRTPAPPVPTALLLSSGLEVGLKKKRKKPSSSSLSVTAGVLHCLSKY